MWSSVKTDSVRARDAFSKTLRPVGLIAWINNTLAIPAGLVNAKLLSAAVTAALSGDVKRVIQMSLLTFACVVTFKALSLFLDIFGSRQSMRAMHHCKMALYKRLLSAPLRVLFSLTSGEMLEI